MPAVVVAVAGLLVHLAGVRPSSGEVAYLILIFVVPYDFQQQLDLGAMSTMPFVIHDFGVLSVFLLLGLLS